MKLGSAILKRKYNEILLLIIYHGYYLSRIKTVVVRTHFLKYMVEEYRPQDAERDTKGHQKEP